jgi:hypothetical protein
MEERMTKHLHISRKMGKPFISGLEIFRYIYYTKSVPLTKEDKTP